MFVAYTIYDVLKLNNYEWQDRLTLIQFFHIGRHEHIVVGQNIPRGGWKQVISS